MHINIEQLLPHRYPMIMIDELLTSENDSAVAIKCFDDNSYGTCDGIVAQPLLVEAMAQTVAALHGKHRQQNGMEPSPGMLVGIDSFEFIALAKTKHKLEIFVRIDKVLGQFRIASGTISQLDKLIAKGQMKFYINDN
jgi:predicted hotdog family 3-hydroxylacyl-ACP dehydratase